MTDIAVWGLGKMGLPLALIFAHAGFNVTGIDVDEKKVAQLNAGENPLLREPGLDALFTSALGNFKASATAVGADIHIIIIPILLKNSKADLSLLTDVCQKISGVLKRGNIVILESTAPPGTCEMVVTPILEKTGLKAGVDFGVAHCPERTMAGTAIKDITGRYPKIIGASDPQTGETLKEVYTQINTKGVILTEDIKTAEAVKVFEGIYRDVNIALANELALYCERAGIDVKKVIKAANTQPYCHLHEPGAGVGGHCIPVYPYFIMSENTPLIKTARKINDAMPYHIVDLAEKMLKTHGIPMKKAKVTLLGISFRGNVKEERFSPFFSVKDELIKRGAAVYGYDPLYTKEEIESYKVIYSNDFAESDIIIILTDHKEFTTINWDQIHQKGVTMVIDGRNMLDAEKMKTIGFDYTGIGRGEPERY